MSKLDQALIGDDELANPALLDLPRGVRLVHVEAIAYAARHHTDGMVSRAALRRLTDEPDADAAATMLVEAGLWHEADAGWLLDWSNQIAAEDAIQITTKNREYWAGQKRHARGRHGEWCPANCHVRADSPEDIGADIGADISEESSTPLPNLTVPVRNVTALNGSSRESAHNLPPEVQEVVDQVARWTGAPVPAPTTKMVGKIKSLVDRHGIGLVLGTLEEDVSGERAMRPNGPPPLLRQLIFRAEDRLDPIHRGAGS